MDWEQGEVRFDRKTRTFWMRAGSRWLTAQQAPSGAAMPPYTPLLRRLSAEARAAFRRVRAARESPRSRHVCLPFSLVLNVVSPQLAPGLPPGAPFVRVGQPLEKEAAPEGG